MRPDPSTRPRPQVVPLVRMLADHDIRWVLHGSQVLVLHGAPIVPNDLDIVPDLDAENLGRLAGCLTSLDAVPAYFPCAAAPMDSIEACLAWRPEPPTATNLDQLLVTRLGMLDVVIALAEPYETLLSDATTASVGDIPVDVCSLRRVLDVLETKDRRKDRERRGIYGALRRGLGS